MTAVIFGRGKRAELRQAFSDGARVVVLATPGREVALDDAIADASWREVARYTEIPQHVPRATLDAASALVREHEADGVLAFGGGSPIGVAKALAIEHELRKVYVPTTYSGSEATAIWAVSEGGAKTTGRDERVRADLVIYDADLIDGMPLQMVFVSLFNALAHAVEALYAPGATADVLTDAEDAAAALTNALRALVGNDSRGAREEGFRGAHLSGRALDGAQMGLHHKLAHVLGGTLGLPHGEVHTVMLPYSLRYNSGAAPDAIRRLAQSTGGDPVARIVELQRGAGVVMDLSSLGMEEVDIPRVVEALWDNPYPNPRPLDRDALTDLMRDAWAGKLRR